MPIKFSQATKEELEIFLFDWAKQEGWKYSSADLEAYSQINGKNIYTVRLINIPDKPDIVIGCISITTYKFDDNSNVTSLGLFIVKKDYRNFGYGQIIFQEALSRTNGLVCLNSVPKASSLYKRNGFFESNIENFHFEVNLEHITLKPTVNASGKRLHWDKESLSKILDFENFIFNNNSCTRNYFNSVWLARPDAILVGVINNNKLEGYGVLTKCDDNSTRIAPLYSSSIVVTANILDVLLSFAKSLSTNTIEMNITKLSAAYNINLLNDYGFVSNKESNTNLLTTQPDFKPNICNQIVALSPLEFPHEASLTKKLNF